MDTNGFLLLSDVHPANEQDRDAAGPLLVDLTRAFPTLRHLWADAGYAGELVEWVRDELGLELEIVRRDEAATGFVVQPRRWVVERTFAWLGRNRRLAKDYEEREESSEAWIHLALIRLMLRRLRPDPRQKAYVRN